LPYIPGYQPGQVGPVQDTNERLEPANNNGGIAGGLASGLEEAGGALDHYAKVQDTINFQNDDTQSRLSSVDAGQKVGAVKQQYSTMLGGNARAGHQQAVDDINSIVQDTLSQATNPRMKRMLQDRLADIQGSAIEDITGHALQQSQIERAGAFKAEIGLNSDNAVTEQDPAKRAVWLDKAKVATSQALDFQGVADPDARALALKQTTSGVHIGVLDSYLAQADPQVDLAAAYLAAHRDEMLPDDIRKAETDLQHPLQQRQANNDFLRATGGGIPDGSTNAAPSAPGAAPNTLAAITAQTESSNRDFTDSGAPVTSVKGAKYAMQVMPATARDPGYGIKPAANDSPAEYNRVGTQLLTKLMQIYVDPAKAWAAYNWSKAGVDAAVKKYGAGWLNDPNIPAETRAYVAKNVASVDARGDVIAAPRQWDKAGVYANIDATADKEGWDFERRQRAKQFADTEIAQSEDLQDRANKAMDEQAFAIVRGMGDGFTSINQLPRTVRDGLTPEASARYQDIADRNSKPDKVQADGPAAMTLNLARIMQPDQFKAVNLADYQGKVTPGEMNDLLQKQAELRVKKTTEWNPSGGITSAISYGETVGGTKLKPDEKSQVAQTMEAQANALHSQGKEVDFNGLYRKAIGNVATVHHGWFGDTPTSTPLYQLTTDSIPAATKTQIVSTFRRERGRDPSDAELMQTYRATYPFVQKP
jgi:soluble lytic murein transglycosylase